MRRKTSTLAIFFATGLAALPALANADCGVTSPELMYLGDNATYDIALEMRPKDHCSINYVSRGDGVFFQSLSIEQAPKAGKLVKVGDFVFDFSPGETAAADGFTLKLCGADVKGKGCSLLRYSAKVR